MPSILIIDDEQDLANTLIANFQREGWDAAFSDTGAKGLQASDHVSPEIILLDMKLPDMDGLEVLKRLRERQCAAAVIVMTGQGSIANAVEAIKLGADQYLTKPLTLVELNTLVRRILEMRKLAIENRYYRRRQDHPVVGVSLAIHKLHHMIDLMAENADTTTLLLGESGTGKELVAREIHRRSARSERPFLDINCAAIPQALLESEMFGHERGAFTDAREMKRGLFEVADGGTVFLDEIGELPLAMQPKLLRVLETRSFKRVGGTRDLHVNVRLIAATNRDLLREVEAGRFREDLYYRLKVFPVEIVPLRQRPEDVPILAEYFLKEFGAALSKPLEGIPPAVVERMQEYPWPGNVRELRNVMERAVVLATGPRLGMELLPPEVSGLRRGAGGEGGTAAQGRAGRDRSLEEVERDHIRVVLERHSFNRSAAARVLGISRSTLIEKIKKYGIVGPA